VPLPGDPFQTCEVHLLSSAPPSEDPLKEADHNAFVQVLTTDPIVTTHRPPLRTEDAPLKAGSYFHASRDRFILRVRSESPYDEKCATRLPVDEVVTHKRYVEEDYRRSKSKMFFRGE
jgi:hypothetical protein